MARVKKDLRKPSAAARRRALERDQQGHDRLGLRVSYNSSI
jgi:hypothetical protein